jgi:hypothetical protein
MKYDIPFRIRVTKPLAGVVMKVQRGSDEFLEPTSVSDDGISFEFPVTADISGAEPNFLGKYAQGPKNSRFLYVNSGRQAGQAGTCWDRRAKLSLMEISKTQVESAIATPGARIETTFPGIGRDGGPTCASVKGLVWEVKN